MNPMTNLDVCEPCLPPPPPSVVDDGELASGRYAGRIARIDWSGLRAAQQRSAWWRRCHHKRWQYVGLAAEHWFIGLAIVDLGWAMSAFVYVFDRQRRQVVLDWSQDGLPGLSGWVRDQPVQGGEARFRGLGAELCIRPVAPEVASDALAVRVVAGGLRLQVELDLSRAPPFLLAVGPVQGGLGHATQKSPGLPATGWFELNGQRHVLQGATGSLDSSNGLLARETAWRWASAHDGRLGFNLQQGYFGDQENVLWLDGALLPLGAATFVFDPARPLAPWHIHTDDGLLDLRFRPEGARQARRDVWIAASDYIQPVGTFHGWVRAAPGGPTLPVEGLLGVTEDHRSRW